MTSGNWVFAPGSLQGKDSDILIKTIYRPGQPGKLAYKYCINNRKQKEYYTYFRYEYSHMKQLEGLMAEAGHEDIYRALFPVYHGYGYSPSGHAFVVMDYIPGDTLEQRLHRSDVPVDPRRIRHLFDQLHLAQTLLCQAGMLQMDLSTENIIVVNDRYDIRLIDFTDAFFTSLHIRGTRQRSHKLIDFHVSRELSPERQLAVAGACLFTRLFYRGEPCYSHEFRLDPLPASLQPYRSLLDCLAQRKPVLETSGSNDLPHDWLREWNRWYAELCRLFP